MSDWNNIHFLVLRVKDEFMEAVHNASNLILGTFSGVTCIMALDANCNTTRHHCAVWSFFVYENQCSDFVSTKIKSVNIWYINIIIQIWNILHNKINVIWWIPILFKMNVKFDLIVNIYSVLTITIIL